MKPRRRPTSRRRSHQSPAVYGSRLINSRGGSRKWSEIVKDFVARYQVCWIRFPKCTIRATTIDHYHPMKTHPHLTDIPSNWRPACQYCNRARRATPVHKLPELRARLEAEYRGQPKALGFFR